MSPEEIRRQREMLEEMERELREDFDEAVRSALSTDDEDLVRFHAKICRTAERVAMCRAVEGFPSVAEMTTKFTEKVGEELIRRLRDRGESTEERARSEGSARQS